MAYPYFQAVDLLRQHSPLVQCLTNSVVMQFTANVLLAAGAAPAMCDTPEESADFAAVADGVLLNAGTPSAEQYRGMAAAIRGANTAGTPWVLDPVAVGGLKKRTDFARGVLAQQPAAIRGNASEITALAGLGTGGRGVDATDSVDSALTAAHLLAERTRAVVAVSGPQDLIVSPGRVTRLHSGDPMLQLVIGTGCSLGALTAAYLGVTRHHPDLSTHDAVVAAHAHMGVAGQLAAPRSQGPGSFAVTLIDALHQVSAGDLRTHSEIQEEQA